MGEKLDSAVAFACTAHAGACRKCTSVPYIVHPVEVMKIVCGLSEDEDVRAAAVLHDTIEDTGAKKEELAALFGDRVADLVAAESENKRPDRPEKATWKIRKSETLKRLESAEMDVKKICLGDKLANIRDIARDFYLLGDDLWNRFNAPSTDENGNDKGNDGKKANIGRYYRGVADRLKSELGSSVAWAELDALITRIFGI